MRKRIILVAFGICCVTICLGQKGWKFRSTDYLGFAAGELGSYGQVRTVNGLYKGSWFLGLGAELDYYRYRSLPLFFSIRRDLPVSGKRSGLFLELDGGVNLPWYKRQLGLYDWVTTSKFHAGPYGSAGVGWQWKLGPQSGKALLFSAGYSIKKLKEDQTAPTICYNPGVCAITSQTYVYNYVLNTFFCRLGFQF